MTPSRRKDDDSDEDFSGLRGVGLPNGHTKWVIGVVSAAIVASLGYLLIRDRVGVDTQIQRLDSATLSLNVVTAQHEAQIQVLRAKQDRVLEDLHENGRKLDQLLAEIRKR